MVFADILSSAMVMASAAPHAFDPDGGAATNSALEYTISLGNLLTIGSFLVFITIYVVNSRGAAKILSARLEIVDASMEDFRNEIKKLADIMVGQAQQDGHINLLDQRLMQQGQRLDELSRTLGEFKNMILQDTLKRPSAA